MLNQDAPLPTPDDLGSLAYAVLDLEGRIPDLEVQQDVYATGDALLAEQRQPELVLETEHPDLDPPNLTMQSPWPGEVRLQTGTRPQTETKTIASRCAPCRFAGVKKVLLFLVFTPYRRPILIPRF